MPTYYRCVECGEMKEAQFLQPSTDAKDRWRLGLCSHDKGDKKRRLSTFRREESRTPQPTVVS